MGEVIYGECLGHRLDRGFVYQYVCPCGRTFTDVSPELSAPALCHWCYTGTRPAEHRGGTTRRGAAHAAGKSRRKNRHQSKYGED